MGSKGDLENGVDVELPRGLYDRPVKNFRRLRVVVIGAGYSGLYCDIRIPKRLRNVDLCIYDKNAGIGGTWYENRYPGCACDVPSHSYQYSFEPNLLWSSLYAPAPEILAYLHGVAKKFSVERFVKLSHKVEELEWQDDVSKWCIRVTDLTTGDVFTDEADVVINARGLLNDQKFPDFESFGGLQIPVMHSANWDDSQDLAGKRVGAIGGDSSAIQIIPQIQKLKDIHLSCFARSRRWIAPPFADHLLEELGMDSPKISVEKQKRFANDSEYYRKFRGIIERDGNSIHEVTFRNSPLQNEFRKEAISGMKQRLASNPELFNDIVPEFSVGCRRLTPGPGYLEALTADNVDVYSTEIARAHPTGLELVDAKKIDLGVLICATGFSAAVAPPFKVSGVNGQTLASRFAKFPETYLSLSTDGFPNYFTMFGPHGGVGTGPLTILIEAVGDYIVKAIRKMQKENIVKMEPKARRVKDFVQYADTYFQKTVYVDDCRSYYRTGGRVSAIWPGSVLHAAETLRSPRWEDWEYEYEGEKDGEETNRLGWLGNGWSMIQKDSSIGDMAHFLHPDQMDVPEGPLPEHTAANFVRPFSY